MSTELSLVGLISKQWVGKYVEFSYMDDDYPNAYRRGIITRIYPKTITLLENRPAMSPSIVEHCYQLYGIREIQTFSKRPTRQGQSHCYIYRNGNGMLLHAVRTMNRKKASDIRFDRELLEKSWGQKILA